ncbi:MAG: aromatic ring-hydroxylating dioxygenase subunit alpha [Planctomycetota bacterium]|nr:aromatic ring-hydroxylating dioxygenase subunit alpha [Planctomycetota bacterium]
MTAQTLEPAAADLAAELAAQRRPGWSLPQGFYTHPRIFEHELARVWRRGWLLAGFACQIPRPGDYFLFTLQNDSVIVVRDGNGAIRAHHNTCRHRGSAICTQPSGHARKLVCPYHQWVYDGDGRLAHAREMPAGFDPAGFGLQAVHVRDVGGLIYLCLADDPPDYRAAWDLYGPQLRPHGFERAKIACTTVERVRANWKLVFENNRECYHCPGGHPEYCTVYPGAAGRAYEREAEDVLRARRERRRALGLSEEAVNFPGGAGYRCERCEIDRKGFVTESLDGRPVAPLMGDFTDYGMGSLRIIHFPNQWMQAQSDHAVCTRLTPLAPGETEVRTDWLVAGGAVEGRDYELGRLTAMWRATNAQDFALCENNQAGVRSSAYRPGPYSEHEAGVEQFVAWYLRQLA